MKKTLMGLFALVVMSLVAQATTNITDAVETLQGGVTGVVSAVAGAVLAIAAVGLVIWGILFALRKAKSSVGR